MKKQQKSECRVHANENNMSLLKEPQEIPRDSHLLTKVNGGSLDGAGKEPGETKSN